jgi:RNA polymerase sigma factor (sigma-70 family)
VNNSFSEIDQQLLAGVRSGDGVAWAELVSQFQGRLVAFARRRLGQNADAEDVVQETFLSLLKSLGSFRGEASLETWLFQLLRRRIADAHRRAGRDEQVQDCLSDASGGITDISGVSHRSAGIDQSASWYVRKEEQAVDDRTELLRAVIAAADRLKAESRFQDLKAFDLLFFAHWKNQKIAQELNLEETAVAVLKHRFIQRVSKQLSTGDASDHEFSRSSDMLTEVWRDGRPSCPKRTTLGKYILGTLVVDWDDFVSFHIERLGCEYCAANLDDLSAEINAPTDGLDEALRGRIMESTVGFLNRRDASRSSE